MRYRSSSLLPSSSSSRRHLWLKLAIRLAFPLVTALSKFHIILYYVYHMIDLQESINISHPHGLYISYLLAVSFCRQLASIVRRICINSSFIAPFLVLAVTNGHFLYYCNACAYVHVVYCGIIVIQISGGYTETCVMMWECCLHASSRCKRLVCFFELLAIGAFESVHRGYLKCGKKERRYASVECVGASDLSVGVSANLFEIRDGT